MCHCLCPHLLIFSEEWWVVGVVFLLLGLNPDQKQVEEEVLLVYRLCKNSRQEAGEGNEAEAREKGC